MNNMNKTNERKTWSYHSQSVEYNHVQYNMNKTDVWIASLPATEKADTIQQARQGQCSGAAVYYHRESSGGSSTWMR